MKNAKFQDLTLENNREGVNGDILGNREAIDKVSPFTPGQPTKFVIGVQRPSTRSLHVAELVRDALRNMGKIVAASKVALLGASYREDVGDTRYSGSEIVVRKLTEMGAEIVIHDPYVKHWWELEKQESYPAPGHSWSRFFRNQEKLAGTAVQNDLPATLKGVDALVLAVRHEAYMTLDPYEVIKMTGRPVAVIDCFGILDDEKIKRYFELGCEVKGLGRGHVKRIEDAAQSFGAENKGKKACALAEIACTSFFPAKPLGCYGDGGMCFTDNDELAAALDSIRVHGKGSHKYDNARIGINGRLDTLQAAILLAKFEIFPEEAM